MIELKTYAGSNVTPQNDAIMNDTNTLNNGIYYGCNVTIKDATTLHINAGQGIVYGRLFEVLDSDIPVSLSPSGTLLGQLYVHIDLSNIAAPIQILVDTGETLADLEDDPQLNIDSGITDMQLATFTVSTVGMSDLVETFKAVEPIRAVLGDADISTIGDGTVKGSIRAINTHLFNVIPSSNVIDSKTPMMAYTQANTLHLVVNGTAINGTDYVVTPGLYKVFHFAGNPLALTEGQEKSLGYCCGTDVITDNVSNVNISAVYTGGNTYIVSKLQTHWLSFHFVIAI